MKKLDLLGGELLRELISAHLKEKTAESLSRVLSCLRDSEVWLPITVAFFTSPDDSESNGLVRPKKLDYSPLFVENDGETFLCVFTWLDQIKKIPNVDNFLKVNFLDCMSWALSYSDTAGIVVDVETKPFYIQKDLFDEVAKLEQSVEDEYTYMKVRFKAGGRAYYYQTQRTDLSIGDKVIVPFGQYDKEKIGTIIKIDKYDSENLPYSYFSTKYLLRKANEGRVVKRKDLLERILLQEEQSYQILKELIEKENLFSFDAYYNTIFMIDDLKYEEISEWQESEISIKQREVLIEKYKSAFDELDKAVDRLNLILPFLCFNRECRFQCGFPVQ